MATIRAFIAIDLPQAAKAELGRISQALDRTLPRGAVRWVKPEQMHLTIRFLGDTAVDKLPAIPSVMDSAVGGQRGFDLFLGRLGCFPNPQRPRVIWVGLTDHRGQDSPALTALKQAIDAGLAPLGWELETKPYRAHLTLGRVKDERGIHDLELTTAVHSLVVPVATLQLIESDLRPGGPIYTVRHASHLAA